MDIDREKLYEEMWQLAQEAKTCENCGALNPKDATVCEECGEEFVDKPRVIMAIAMDIVEDWGKDIPSYVKPYLRALTQLETLDDFYGSDSAYSVISYFLANAEEYNTPKSQALLEELEELLK